MVLCTAIRHCLMLECREKQREGEVHYAEADDIHQP